ncbi:hypothetical protein GGX14DRAFT_660809 [Mycena pura]|uniref:Uncharacterized protein n=1 Tax=Mycena pura TaxID=153505 RepID=A0AAD6Y6Y8_9AGAR|nr:hypothetical protein GGX14DRAFT_660809 [Mycena pura]
MPSACASDYTVMGYAKLQNWFRTMSGWRVKSVIARRCGGENAGRKKSAGSTCWVSYILSAAHVTAVANSRLAFHQRLARRLFLSGPRAVLGVNRGVFETLDGIGLNVALPNFSQGRGANESTIFRSHGIIGRCSRATMKVEGKEKEVIVKWSWPAKPRTPEADLVKIATDHRIWGFLSPQPPPKDYACRGEGIRREFSPAASV